MRIPQPLFADDDGSPDPALTVALAGGDPYVIAAALAKARIFVALQAGLDSASINLDGVKIEQESHLSLTWLMAGSARALPVFTSVAQLTAWNPLARPLGVESARAAAVAASEGAVLVIDPGAGQVHEVSRSAVRAIVLGYDHLPLWHDQILLTALADAVATANADGVKLTAVLSQGNAEVDALLSVQIASAGVTQAALAAFLDGFTSDERVRSRLDRGLEVEVLR